MWNLITHKRTPPTRLIRFCCEHLKEASAKGRLKITGVRKSESISRANNHGLVTLIGKPQKTERTAQELGAEYIKNNKGGLILNLDNDESRRTVEHCFRTTSTMINPIIDWDEDDVWNFLNYYKCESNPLYKCGKSRVGCVGCPMAGGPKMKEEFIKYPKIRDNYLRTFHKMLISRQEAGLENKFGWTSAAGVMRWWVGDDMSQLSFFDAEYLKDIPDYLKKPI